MTETKLTTENKQSTENKPERHYGKVLLTSQTGKGKTYSFRNLPADKTGFLNVENKPLPFRTKFKHHIVPTKLAGILKALREFDSNPEIEVVAVDSLTAIFELIEKEMSDMHSGYDIWSNYNTGVRDVLTLIKSIKKDVFVTSHYEILNLEKTSEKRVTVLGKRWEGKIEKEFTFVMYADCKFKEGVPEYYFQLAGEGMSAKCPPDVFTDEKGKTLYRIPNDSEYIRNKIVEYYSI